MTIQFGTEITHKFMTNTFFKKRLVIHIEQITLVHYQAVSQTEKTIYSYLKSSKSSTFQMI